MLRYLCYSVSHVKRSPTMRSLTNQSSAILITGGLEKFQGGLKEESYFLNENNKLITKMQQHGLQQNAEKINHNLLNAESAYVQPRETCSLSKHKNYQEEAFFFTEQNECTKRFSKRMSDENFTTDREEHDEEEE